MSISSPSLKQNAHVPLWILRSNLHPFSVPETGSENNARGTMFRKLLEPVSVLKTSTENGSTVTFCRLVPKIAPAKLQSNRRSQNQHNEPRNRAHFEHGKWYRNLVRKPISAGMLLKTIFNSSGRVKHAPDCTRNPIMTEPGCTRSRNERYLAARINSVVERSSTMTISMPRSSSEARTASVNKICPGPNRTPFQNKPYGQECG